MKDLFPDFFDSSADQQNELWRDPYIVFDTNVLLNLYSYEAKTRTRILADLWKIRARIWMPAHVAQEYLGRRIQKIEDQNSTYRKILDELKKLPAPLDQILGKGSLHPTLEKDAIRKTLNDAIARVTKVVEIQERKHAKKLIGDTENDPVLEKLSEIFKNKIGRRWSTEEYVDLAAEGEKRYFYKIPPGFRDDSKSLNKYGDLIIWKQILEWSATHDRPVIFVTDDSKVDWWKLDKAKKVDSPRRELIAEHFLITGKSMFAYNQETFWKKSAKRFGTKTGAESIKEIRRIEEAAQEEMSTQAALNAFGAGAVGSSSLANSLLGTQAALNAFGAGAVGSSSLANSLLGTQAALNAFGAAGAGSAIAKGFLDSQAALNAFGAAGLGSAIAKSFLDSQAALNAFGAAGLGSAIAKSLLQQSRVEPKDKGDGQPDDPSDGDNSKRD